MGEPGRPMQSDGVQFFLMNAMRTGNPVLDMAAAFMVPAALRIGYVAFDKHAKPFLMWLWLWLFNDKDTRFTRVIEFEQNGRSYGRNQNGQDERNNIIQKALALYVGHLSEQIFYKRARMGLIAAKEKSSFDSRSWSTEYGSTVEALNSYSMVTMPSYSDSCLVAEAVALKINVRHENNGEGSTNQRKITEYVFRSGAADGDKRIDAFIAKAFDWYKAEIGRASDENVRYYYTIANPGYSSKSKDGEEPAEDEAMVARRYPMAMRKTFSSLFFPQKDMLLTLVDNFMHKRGKYAVEGASQKLGLMLHGPPGTGKTSIIKSLAHYTNRHIVNVPLNRITTNQQLIDLMFSTRFTLAGEDVPVKLKQEQVIFVLEDCDAHGCDVLKRRTAAEAGSAAKAAEPEADASKATEPEAEADPAAVNKREHASSDSSDVGSEAPEDSVASDTDSSASSTSSAASSPRARLTPKTAKEEPAAAVAPSTPAQVPAAAPASSSSGTETEAVLGAILGAMTEGGSKDGDKGKDLWASWSPKDKLSLAGILEALDGVLDAPNRLVVLTTNHPEQLDPALIRPGRINRCILLGYVVAESVVSMVNLYFGSCSPKSRDKIARLFSDPNVKLTPAQVEGLAEEHESEDDFVNALFTLESVF